MIASNIGTNDYMSEKMICMGVWLAVCKGNESKCFTKSTYMVASELIAYSTACIHTQTR